METLNNMKRSIILLLLSISIVTCKNSAQSTIKSSIDKSTLKVLPDEIANKTWVYINSIEKKWFKTMLEYNDWEYIETKTNSINIPIDLYDPVRSSQKIESITLKEKGYTIKFDDSKKIEGIDFEWLDKSKGFATWEIKYIDEGYAEFGDTIVRKNSVIKSLITSKNFPKPKEEIIIIGENKPIEAKYIEIKKLPLLGKFYCSKGSSEGYYEARLKFSNDELPIYDEKGNIMKNQPYTIELTLDKNITNIGFNCSLRKIENSSTKYAVFFNYLTEETKTIPKDILHYSKTHPIAEIEILNDNTIKKKWLGFYNLRTKKVEDYGQEYGWDDKCDGIIKRVE